MSRRHIPEALRELVRRRAGERCEYCLVPEIGVLVKHQVDHVVPQKHAGPTTAANLALSCALCNQRKGSDVGVPDPKTGEIVPLFHPRADRWADHFKLAGAAIEPLTATGRATVACLQLNSEFRLAGRAPLVHTRLLVPPPSTTR